MRGDPHGVVFYDGSCGFCNRTVQFILAREHESSRLRFARLEGDAGAALRRRFPAIANVDSIVYLDGNGEPSARSEALMMIAKHLRAPWRLLHGGLWLVPRPLADLAYDAFARRRHRFFQDAACLVPTMEQRERFVD